MKLVELSDQQLAEAVGGGGCYISFSCGWNIPGGPGCQIGFGCSREVKIQGASRDEQINYHNQQQWYWGAAIRMSDDGKEYWATNVAPSGSNAGYR